MTQYQAQPPHPVIRFPRRLGALLYDTLVLAALWMAATVPLMAITGGEAITGGVVWLFRLYLLVIAGAFFGWFWTHGGQTLGMRAWRAKLETGDGQAVNWRQAGLRFLAVLLSIACGGLGYLWALADSDRLTWHDRLSATRVVVTSVEDMERPARA
ncbi:MAG: RDD family protein [Gammaproteobacteria bacterium]|nr:RDD family protein [Gammaproteobacteria bacterium]